MQPTQSYAKRYLRRGYSSAGRALALQAGGQRFDPAYLHRDLECISNIYGGVEID